jgi:hypothetical protein
MASRSAMGMSSSCDGSAKISQLCNVGLRSGFQPKNTTLSTRPRWAISLSNSCSWGPGPAILSLREGNSSRNEAKLRINSKSPLSGIKRHAVPMMTACCVGLIAGRTSADFSTPECTSRGLRAGSWRAIAFETVTTKSAPLTETGMRPASTGSVILWCRWTTIRASEESRIKRRIDRAP